jgi:alanyl aminopeptidase
MTTRSFLTAALLLSAAPFAVAGTHVRLGTDVVPTRETVRLRMDPRAADYTGTASIELDVKRAAPSVSLHAEEMTLRRVTVGGRDATHAAGPDRTVVITPAQPFAVGRTTLVLEFANEYDRRAVGLYKMERADESYLYTQFEADDARKAYPCFDEPGFKIPWQITIEVPSAYDAVSNTPGRAPAERDGWKEVAFAETKPLPSYLVALAVGKFAFTPIEGMGVPGRVVTLRGQEHLAGLAARGTAPLLKAAERYFGLPYPYEKLDLIAVPEYWPGAMEHPGAITFSDGILLLDEKTATPSQRSLMSRVTAHELAHMWFGDLVTMAWWDDLWLNESFADWLGDKITAEVLPEARVAVTQMDDLHRAMETDRRRASVAVRRPVEDPNDLLRSIGIVYNKGKSVLGMFERYLGPERFRDGVRAYVRENAWKNATADRLWTALDRAAGGGASTAIATFIEQPGLPLVSATRVGKNRFVLAQQRYSTAGVVLPPQTWKVPVTLRYSEGAGSRVETFLLDGPSREVTLAVPSVAWVFPNADAAGYYRFDLPAADLQDLADHAAERLSVVERVAFLGNAQALLDAGRIDGARFLQVIGRFGGDADADVAAAALDALGEVDDAFVDGSTRPGFAAYVRRTLRPALDRVGWAPAAAEEPAVTTLRPRLLGWLGEFGNDPDVLREAAALADRLLAGDETVPASLRTAALRIRALDGDAALFAQYRKRFETAASPTDRSRFLAGCVAFRDPRVRAEVLAWALTLRPQELAGLAAGLRGTSEGRTQVFDWLSANFDTIVKRIPPPYHPALAGFAGGCERERLEPARALFTEHQVPAAAEELAKVSEQVDECLALRTREAGNVRDYLSDPQAQ